MLRIQIDHKAVLHRTSSVQRVESCRLTVGAPRRVTGDPERGSRLPSGSVATERITTAPVMIAPPAPVVKTTEPPKEKPPEPKPEPPPQPVKRRRTPPPKQITDAPPPKPAEPEVPAATPAVTGEQPPAAPLQLREILTPERRRQYETEYGASMGRARSVIGRATGRTNLTAAQTETLNRIGTFLKQAEDSRKDDLGTAWQLARRADLLSQELLETLK